MLVQSIPYPAGSSGVVLLAGFNSSANDESSYGRTATLTPSGSGFVLSSTQAKFGTQSLKCVGAAGLCTYPDAPEWPSGSALWTIECWCFRTGTLGGNDALVSKYDNGSPTNQRSWTLKTTSGKYALSLSANGSTVAVSITTAVGPTLNAWDHVAADFDGTKYRLYANGVMIGSSTSLISIFDSTAPVSIGTLLANGTSENQFVGYIDEVRVTVGLAQYASDSGYTVPTAAFPR